MPPCLESGNTPLMSQRTTAIVSSNSFSLRERSKRFFSAAWRSGGESDATPAPEIQRSHTCRSRPRARARRWLPKADAVPVAQPRTGEQTPPGQGGQSRTHRLLGYGHRRVPSSSTTCRSISSRLIFSLFPQPRPVSRGLNYRSRPAKALSADDKAFLYASHARKAPMPSRGSLQVSESEPVPQASKAPAPPPCPLTGRGYLGIRVVAQD
jgi:hypothetical protein